MNGKKTAFFEIFLLIGAVFAFSYIIHESNYLAVGENAEENKFFAKSREAILNWLSNGLVSAQEQIPLSTCLVDNNGKKCQEYLSSECDSKCSESCAPVPLESSPLCVLGSCIDKKSGTCSPNSPKFSCQNEGLEWREEGINEIPQCKQGCCLSNNQAVYTTEQTCKANNFGTDFNFISNINEVQCIAMVGSDLEGACVFVSIAEDKNNCELTTKKECANRNGQFSQGYLCSNPDLNTMCEKQKTTNCVEGKDGVYWFDSCGNRENIYESGSPQAKDRSWNSGKIMELNNENVCELSVEGDLLGSATSCGNCNRFAGSVCSPVSSKTANPVDGNFICRNLGCVDRWENTRQNGESWCVTEGQIGVQRDISSSLNFEEPPEIKVCSESSKKNVLTTQIKVVGEKMELRPGERTDISIEVKNSGDDGNVNDISLVKVSVELDFFDSSGKNVVNSLLIPGGNVKEINLIRSKEIKTVLFSFNIPGDFNQGLYVLSAKSESSKSGIDYCGESSLDKKVINLNSVGNEVRSVDLPGSSHYREVCVDGEVRLEECASGRKDVCSESVGENGFSLASCRINGWQACMQANLEESSEEMKNKCEQNTDCYVKQIQVGNDFGFNRCVPKYPPGFELSQSNSAGQTTEVTCGFATTQCTYVKIKKLFGSKKINEDCIKPEFTETLNNLCISLGDCGGHVNVAGEFSNDGYRVDNAEDLTPGYIQNLKSLTSAIPGQSAEYLKEEEIARLFGLNPEDPNYSPSQFGEILGYVGAGATGVVIVDLCIASGSCSAVLSTIGEEGISEALFRLLGNSNSWAGFYNTFAGAAAGAAIGVVVAKLMGLEGDSVTATVIISAVAGALVAYFGAQTGFLISGIYVLSLGFFAIVIAVAIISGFVFKALGIGKASKTTVEFQCLPWQAPVGGKDCNKCGSDGLSCNKYKCQSLGQACEFINEGTEDEACVNISPSDVTPPVINPNQEALLTGFSYAEISSSGFKVLGSASDGCLPVYTQVQFGIKTDEATQCKTDIVHTNSLGEMSEFFGGSNLYKTTHTMNFALPSLASLSEQGISASKRADFDLLVRCGDKNGNANVPEYSIKFCLSPEDDKTPPLISVFSPESESFVKLDASEKKISFFTNEPAECKWDIQDRDYNLMSNEAFCKNEFEDQTIFGFPCETNLIISGNENNYYFRCKDQPWLEINNPENKVRNFNVQSIIYILKRSASSLTITDVKPKNDKIFSNGPTKINLEVQTSGGAENGKSVCEYKNGISYYPFFQTYGATHKQPNYNIWVEGSYSIPIRCEDVAGNIAEGKAEFTLEFDNSGPLITRVYESSGVLNVITDEKAICRYSVEESCANLIGVTFDSATAIGGQELKHGLQSFNRNLIYTIRCEDVFGNRGSCLQVGGGVY